MPDGSKAIQNRPILMSGLEFYLNAFLDLQTERQIGMSGASPIPFTSIVKWCEFNGLDYEESDKLMKFVRALEAEQFRKEKKNVRR